LIKSGAVLDQLLDAAEFPAPPSSVTVEASYGPPVTSPDLSRRALAAFQSASILACNPLTTPPPGGQICWLMVFTSAMALTTGTACGEYSFWSGSRASVPLQPVVAPEWSAPRWGNSVARQSAGLLRSNSKCVIALSEQPLPLPTRLSWPFDSEVVVEGDVACGVVPIPSNSCWLNMASGLLVRKFADDALVLDDRSLVPAEFAVTFAQPGKSAVAATCVVPVKLRGQ